MPGRGQEGLKAGVGGVLAAYLAGRMLVEPEKETFTLLASALVTSVLAEFTTRFVLADLSATWGRDMRSRLTRKAFRQKLRDLAAAPVGEFLDRIDDDTHQVATAVRDIGLHFLLGLVVAALGVVAAFLVWAPAGAMFLLTDGAFVVLVRPKGRRVKAARVREEEAWSDLAAILEEGVYGQDDIRTSLGQPYILKTYAAQSAEVLRRGREVWDLSARLAAEQGEVGGGRPRGGEIRITNLTHAYDPESGRPALQDVTLTFQPGRSYALLGRTGSGKSTLAKVLVRGVDVPRGHVTFDGADVNDLDPDTLRKDVASLTQRTSIYTGTLRENVPCSTLPSTETSQPGSRQSSEKAARGSRQERSSWWRSHASSCETPES